MGKIEKQIKRIKNNLIIKKCGVILADLNLPNRIFLIAVILLVAWLLMIVLEKTLSIDPNQINNVGTALEFVIGALIGAYIQGAMQKDERVKKRGKKRK